MNMTTKIKPFINIPPGEFIQEEIESRNWTQKDLAQIIGESAKYINDLRMGRQSISAKAAKQLSSAFGQSPDYWLNLQNNYNLRKEKSVDESSIAWKSALYEKFPVAELIKKRWLPNVKDTESLSLNLSKLTGIEAFSFSNLTDRQLAFRKSEAYDQFNENAASVWYCIAKQQAGKIRATSYKPSDLETLLLKIPGYTNAPNGIEVFLEELESVGVKFLVIEHLAKTYIDGASFYDDGNPVIVYTARQDRTDNFWFVMAHEIAHILNHFSDNSCFIDQNINNINSPENPIEEEANTIALQILKEKEMSEFFYGIRYISRQKIEIFAETIGISPAIVVGVLQYKGKLPWRNLNEYKSKASNLIPVRYIFPKGWEVGK
jgi:HTH-type transcriptional regulator/antitoxin HigA